MFLHNKATKSSSRRLKCAVKLDFGAKGSDLRSCYNALREGNRLVSRFKRKELYLFYAPKQAIAASGDTVFVMTAGGLLSLLNGLFVQLTKTEVQNVSTCIYRGDVIVSAKDMGTYIVNQKTAQSVYGDGFSSLAVCADRIFGLQQNQVRYTAAGERDGFSKGEMITLPTDCDALAVIDDEVYVLGNTCYTITPKADDVEFKFNFFAHNMGAVAARSVVNYNGRAVFATSNGMYQIYNGKITPIFTELNEAVDFSNSVGTLFDGKYYLCCRSRDGSEEDNDVTLVLDLDEEEIAGVLDVGFDSICATDSKIYVTKSDHIYWLWEAASPAHYVKSNINFASDRKKFLDLLTVTTRSDLDVAIHSERETRLYKIKGKKTAQKINLRDMGWDFSIELTSNDGFDVENLSLEAHVCEEV